MPHAMQQKYVQSTRSFARNALRIQFHVTRKQLELIVQIKENRGEKIGDSELKKLKKMTKEEASDFISSEQTLF